MIKLLKSHLKVVFLFVFTVNSSLFAQTGKIGGRVTEVSTGDPLPGANLYFPDLNIGTSSDAEGYFYLSQVPVGDKVLYVSYVGYTEKHVPVEIKEGELLKLEVELEPSALSGDTVVVTAQASAQRQAINQQLNAKTIINVVSSKGIRQLPESNAAEAVGRLPGISLQRQGGEGTKIIIRGMAPQYTKVQVDGVNIAATGSGDRSVDVGMISPYMLEGIEVSKSIMANQEADATGGIVNFRIRKAPDKTQFNILTQGMYSGVAKSYDQYKVSVDGSSRFYNNLFGIYAQVDIEQKNTSSDQLGNVNFYQENEQKPVDTYGMQLMDVNRELDRYGAALVMDYSTTESSVKFSNFFSKINRKQTQHNLAYNYQRNDFGRSLVDNPGNKLTILINSIRYEQYFGKFKLDAGASQSYSKNEVPEQLNQAIYLPTSAPFGDLKDYYFNYLDPYTIPDSLKMDNQSLVNNMLLGNLHHNESATEEREWAFDLNFSYEQKITNLIKLDFKFGGKYKHKSKEYDLYSKIAHVGFGGPDAMAFRDMIITKYWDQLSQRNRDNLGRSAGSLWYYDFTDPDYDGSGFLGGRYDITDVPNLEWFREIDDQAIADGLYLNDNITSVKDDYYGTEEYWAGYIMPEINIGKKLVIIPGVRYESNRTDYTAYRGDTRDVIDPNKPFSVDTANYIRKNNYWLPMMQAFYKPLKWLNIKAGYTHTLQRPSYSQIVPKWMINRSWIEWNNYKLKPERATNYDLQFSFYSDKLGVLSVGGFYKYIEDMIFWTGTKVILDPEEFGLPLDTKNNKSGTMINNQNPATNYGFEIEWKSNFWYLPGLLKGLVININYTKNNSEAKYLLNRIKTGWTPDFQPIFENNDTTYTNPMILQPEHLLNLTLGYDYKGFSIRYAFRFKSHIFTRANQYEDLRGYSTDFIRHDIAVKQQLPVRGLELYLNMNNIADAYMKDVIAARNLVNSEEHYGRFISLGLRYSY